MYSCFFCIKDSEESAFRIDAELSEYLYSCLGLCFPIPSSANDVLKKFQECDLCSNCKEKVEEVKRLNLQLQNINHSIRLHRERFYDALQRGYFEKLSLRNYDEQIGFPDDFREKIVQALQLVINIGPENTIVIDEGEFGQFQIVEVKHLSNVDDGNNDMDDRQDTYTCHTLPLSQPHQPMLYNTNTNSSPSEEFSNPIVTQEMCVDNVGKGVKFDANDLQIRNKFGITQDLRVSVERVSTDTATIEALIWDCNKETLNGRSTLYKKSQKRINGRLKCLYPKCIVTFRNETIRRAHLKKFHLDSNSTSSTLNTKHQRLRTTVSLQTCSSGAQEDKMENDDNSNHECCVNNDGDNATLKVCDSSKRLPCTQCSATFASNLKLNSHLLRYHGQGEPVSNLVCQICNKTNFKTRKQYSYHTMYHRPKRFSCSYCQKKFVRAPDLRRHEKIHASNLSRALPLSSMGSEETQKGSSIQRTKHTCERDGCTSFFYEKYRLETHVRKIHLGVENPFKCRFPNCMAELRTRRLYDEHLRMSHRPPMKVWKCKICSNTEFQSRPAYDVHMDNTHPDAERKGNWSCRICEMKFRTLDLRSIHMKQSHGRKSYTRTKNTTKNNETENSEQLCQICGKSVIGAKKLKDHLKYHTPRNHVCHCGKGFSRKADLRRHMLVHSAENRRPSMCETCGKCFKDNSYLKIHARKCSSGDRPKFPCTVEGCNQVYANESSLKLHFLDHQGLLEKKYKCDLCDFKVRWPGQLQYHRRSHFPDQEFKCNWPSCTAKFKQKNSLSFHVDFKHLGKRGKLCHYEGCHFRGQDKQSLEDHLRTHTGERPFTCSCGKAFKKKCHFRRHQKTQHQGCNAESDSTTAKDTVSTPKRSGRPRKLIMKIKDTIYKLEEQPVLQQEHSEDVAEYLVYALTDVS